MSSTNKTANYQLSQFVGTDIPSILNDYNGDMRKIDSAIKDASVAGGDNATAIAELQTTTSRMSTEIGGINSTVNTLNGKVVGIESVIPNNATPSNKVITVEDISEIPEIGEIENDVESLTEQVNNVKSCIPTSASSSNKLVTTNELSPINLTLQRINNVKPNHFFTTYDSSETLLDRLQQVWDFIRSRTSGWNADLMWRILPRYSIYVGKFLFRLESCADVPGQLVFCATESDGGASIRYEMLIDLGNVNGHNYMPTDVTMYKIVFGFGSEPQTTRTDITSSVNSDGVKVVSEAGEYVS